MQVLLQNNVWPSVCSSDVAYSIILSLSSRGGQDISVFVAGGFVKPKWIDLFLQQ